MLIAKQEGRVLAGNSPAALHSRGMTLRDYFAAKAMQGFSASPNELFTDATFSRIAEYAYSQADAMLAAREAKL